jgi:hypothetical protein
MDESLRQLVRERAANRCEYCRIPQHALSWATFHIEHIRARQHGGSDEPENLALACRRCNLFKGPNLSAIDPETDELLPLFNPRTDIWTDHFADIDHRIVGRTSIGRATAELLDMNDADRIQIRFELDVLGENGI